MKSIVYLGNAGPQRDARVEALRNDGIQVTVLDNIGPVVTVGEAEILVVDGGDEEPARLCDLISKLTEGASTLALYRGPRHGEPSAAKTRAALLEAGAADVALRDLTDRDFVTRVKAILLRKRPLRVLVVEDVAEMANWLATVIAADGAVVSIAENLAAARAAFAAGPVDVVVIDRRLPDGDGLEFLTELRGRGIQTPALLHTALSEWMDRQAGLEARANAYLVKPVEARELVFQIRYVLRPTIESETLVYGPLEIARRDRVVRWRGALVDLKPRDYALLAYLSEREGLAVPQKVIRQDIWGQAHVATNSEANPIAVAKYRLARALRDAGVPDCLETIDDCYRFAPAPLLDLDAG